MLPASSDPALERILAACKAVSAGDLEARIIGLDDHPQWATAARTLNQLLDTVDSFVRESSAAMSACSRGEFHRPILLRGMPGALRSSSLIINQAGLRMKENAEALEMVARLAEENSLSTNAVAAAAEELNTTTSTIAQQARATMDVATASVQQSTEASHAIEGINRAFSEIENLRALIRSIAEKTNLLAFNASIEAARAGSAGTRFAVVAGEVKKLATDTSGATDRIRTQVETMRSALDHASSLIHHLREELARLQDASASIANITQEQSSATAEISSRMSEISSNTRQVSQRISRST